MFIMVSPANPGASDGPCVISSPSLPREAPVWQNRWSCRVVSKAEILSISAGPHPRSSRLSVEDKTGYLRPWSQPKRKGECHLSLKIGPAKDGIMDDKNSTELSA